MKKVLFFIESLAGGGAERVLATLVKMLDKSKFDITVCSVVNVGPYVQEVQENTNRYTCILGKSEAGSLVSKLMYKIKYFLIYKILSASMVYRFFVPKCHDIEIAFVEGFATKIIAVSSNRKCKKIAWVHTDLLNNHWTQYLYKKKNLEEKSYKKFDVVIGVSTQVRKAFMHLFPEINNEIIINNPIDVGDIIKKSLHSMEFFPRPKHGSFVSIGRLVQQKGYDRLIRIVQRLTEEKYDIDIYILGEGVERSSLEKQIGEANINTKVHLIGFKKNPYPYIKQADAFICSSYAEGYSTAATESLLIGTPVITTRVSGMDELLQEDKYGIISNNDEEALYHAIKKYLQSKEERTRLRKNAQGFRFSYKPEKIIKEIERILS